MLKGQGQVNSKGRPTCKYNTTLWKFRDVAQGMDTRTPRVLQYVDEECDWYGFSGCHMPRVWLRLQTVRSEGKQ